MANAESCLQITTQLTEQTNILDNVYICCVDCSVEFRL